MCCLGNRHYTIVISDNVDMMAGQWSHADSYTAVSLTLLPDSSATALVSYSPGLTVVLDWGWVAVSPPCDSDW